jgi:hypothetical protein
MERSREMVTVSGEKYVRLGHLLEGVRISFFIADLGAVVSDDEEGRIVELKNSLKELIKCCEELGLSRAQDLVSYAYDNLPQTKGEWDILLRAVMADIRNTVFLFIPDHLAKYYEIIFPSTISTAFPEASKELVAAGNCLAAGLFTACVFHAMRAAEVGLRVLGKTLNVTFKDKPLELADWQPIIEQCEAKIKEMKGLQPKAFREEELNFYSQAAAQFTYFKDGFRLRAAHARETFDETQAIRIFNHTWEFFDTLSKRLKEPKVTTLEELLS